MSNEYKSWFNDEVMDYAYQKHYGQLRKYTNKPYIFHPMGVAQLIQNTYSVITSKGIIPFDSDLLNRLVNVAYLHDTVEDTDATIEEIKNRFGEYYATLVEGLTNISKPEDGNRAKRKKKDLEHLLKQPIEVQIVKLADVIDNCKDIVKNDKKFAKKYLTEKQQYINALEPMYEQHHFVKALDELFSALYIRAKTLIENELKEVEDL